MIKNIILVFSFFFWIVGCQSTTKPIQQDPVTLSSTNGYVFVEFPTTPYILSVTSLSNSKVFELLPDELNQTAGLWLPPDDYLLHKIRRHIIGPTNEIFDLNGYPSFTVVQGKVTNLGALIDFRIGEGNVVWIQRPSKDTDGRFKNWLSKNNRYLASKVVNSWSVDSVPKAIKTKISGNGLLIDLLIQAENKALDGNMQSEILTVTTVNTLYDVLLKNSLPQRHHNELGIVQLVSDSTGNQYFPAQLGQIKKRNQAGEWASIDTGYTSSIKTLDVENDLIIAGLASGQIIFSSNSGKSWEDLYRFEGIKITKIHKIENRVFVLGYNSTTKRSHIYSSPLSEKMNFIELKRSQEETPFEPMSQQNGSNLYFNLTNNALYKLDSTSLEIEEVSFPDSLINFYVNPIGQMTIMTRSFVGSLYLSDLAGKNWKKIDFPKMGKAYFTSNDAGTAFAWGAVKEFDINLDKWRTIADFQEGCLTTLVDEKSLDLYCIDNRGGIFKYINKVWKKEDYLPSTM